MTISTPKKIIVHLSSIWHNKHWHYSFIYRTFKNVEIIVMKVAVYGDSIAYGFGSGDKSWFDLLPDNYQKSKFAVNGAITEEVLEEILKHDEKFDIIFLAVGINDLFNMINFNYGFLLEQYEEILNIAKEKANKVVVQAVLPMLETGTFPIWFQREEPLKLIIESFNIKLAELAKNRGCIFVDAHSEFLKLDLTKFYADDVHLNRAGQQKLFEIYDNYL